MFLPEYYLKDPWGLHSYWFLPVLLSHWERKRQIQRRNSVLRRTWVEHFSPYFPFCSQWTQQLKEIRQTQNILASVLRSLLWKKWTFAKFITNLRFWLFICRNLVYRFWTNNMRFLTSWRAMPLCRDEIHVYLTILSKCYTKFELKKIIY